MKVNELLEQKLRAGYYVLDANGQISAGPFPNNQDAEEQTETGEKVAHYNGVRWTTAHKPRPLGPQENARRPTVPGKQRHRDMKNDYRRKPKHTGKVFEDIDDEDYDG